MPTRSPKRRNLRGPVGKTGPTGKRGPVGKRGSTGLRGPTGPRGLTGPIGRRGLLGKRGKRGPEGLTGPAKQGDDALDNVMTHFDDVYRQLNIQMKRIAQIQAQLDLLVAAGKATSQSNP